LCCLLARQTAWHDSSLWSWLAASFFWDSFFPIFPFLRR
jgi:hypothetical protein